MSLYYANRPSTAEDSGSAWDYTSCTACGAPVRTQARDLLVHVLEAGRRVHLVDSGPIVVSSSLSGGLTGALAKSGLAVILRPVRAENDAEQWSQLLPQGGLHLKGTLRPCGCAETLPKPWVLAAPAPVAAVMSVIENPRIILVSDALRLLLTKAQPDLEFEEIGEGVIATTKVPATRADVTRLVMKRVSALPAEKRTKDAIDALRDEIAAELGVDLAVGSGS